VQEEEEEEEEEDEKKVEEFDVGKCKRKEADVVHEG
jgi:hypothetical protein